ncbi:unnamed protein product [Danaus chrysippus]|uniref:(African queen) hypothetical protein n=1 Tax=Danaus chrysippus TaxID=151541 RepID=A0A8J2R5L1_9NEOP|nr:unnamed protein product [Danaus chrysippus]
MIDGQLCPRRLQVLVLVSDLEVRRSPASGVLLIIMRCLRCAAIAGNGVSPDALGRKPHLALFRRPR